VAAAIGTADEMARAIAAATAARIAGRPGKKITPVMRQYEEAKAVHPDALLFFRLGDFYELFHEDAVIASRALGLTLTSRNKGAMDEVPMAGVPYHAAHGYIARLLAQGFKVALCEQMADPSKVKGIVPRQVVRVVTPGLITDADQLDARANHYLCAIERQAGDGPGQPGGSWGLALLDLSTGEVAAATIGDAALVLAELARAEPREVLLGEGAGELRAAAALVAPRAALRDDEPLDPAHAGAEIDAAVEAPLAAEARGLHGPVALAAAARALRFARRCTPGARLPVRRIAVHDPSGALAIDETAQRHLELVRSIEGHRRGSLIDVVDGTVTPAGARLLRRRLLAPLCDVAPIRRRLDEVELFVRHARARRELREALGGIGDLERLAVRAVLREATPRDLGGVRDGLTAAPRAVAAVASIPDAAGAEVLGAAVDTLPALGALLQAALVDQPPPHARDGGLVRDGFDAELDELRRTRQGGTELVVALESSLRAETGVPGLRVRYTRVFGWYIEVTRSQLAKVPASWRRKQTVAGGERYTNTELDELAERIESAEERSLAREHEILERLLSAVVAEADAIRHLARTLAGWDVAAGLADVAHRYDYCRPDVDAGEAIVLSEARHPVVERLAAAGRFVPNDTTLDLAGERLWLITGPNMAGKSTLMRQVALIVILAQAGSYVPARHARIGLVDRVLSRVGASDNVSRGESTFMVEMRETAQILRAATRRSLVILDEIGRGTSTYDGLAIAWAVAEHLHASVGCRALFATHYHELCELAKTGPGIANHSVAAREQGDEVVFLHRLVAGPASRSYGVAVARLAGLPEGVLARAKALLAALEAGSGVGGSAERSGRAGGAGRAQLDLFSAAPADKAAQPVLDTLRAVDVDRLTPLDALQLVAKLKTLLGNPPS
jgi:DNA mismatch repair protein MutS